MDISFDPAKRDAALQDRGLDFADAVEVFEGEGVLEQVDDRHDYGETRIITVGICAAGWSSYAGRREAMSGTSSR